ncbi:class I SAM-dependent methyltransferase [Spirosoma sp. BT702]|uniref:Class I SAM-dependent methyltransferase n=1 Tax=Spirosoma profusum TaxID=2771354 RepID=A0A926XYJ2_9BACT|nr:class I SAM-dependent methyltransferase [Spirosoma profusum]MBD2703132.1 class I SAM-dependent methyltransferase [Spirosoma profusum]
MSRQTHSFYNKFSVFYPLVDFFLRPQKTRLFDEVNQLPAGNLLDIGVGNGANLPLYKKHRVTGIDTSFEMLSIASKRYHKQVRLLLMNGEDLLFGDGQFDYVVLSHVIAVVDNPEQLVEEVFRVLKPNGRLFILNHFTPNNWLKQVDFAFRIFARMVHFKSVFYIHELTTIRRFKLLKEVRFGSASYFKLLIYQKP